MTEKGADVRLRWLTGGVLLLGSVIYLLTAVDLSAVGDAIATVGPSLAQHPVAWTGAIGLYAVAFLLRTVAWQRVLAGLSFWQAWAAIHVSLLGNHVLPLRLGEVLRVTSVVRRTRGFRTADVTASVVLLRSGDLMAVVVLAALGAPAMLGELVGSAAWVLALLLLVAVATAYLWVRRHASASLRAPGIVEIALTLIAWIAEAVVIWTAAEALGVPIGFGAAIAVTAVTILAQAVAVTPGGFGTYEAAATAALVASGVSAGPALAVALTAHVVKTLYALAVGGVALWTPAPSYFGPWRLPRRIQPATAGSPVRDGAPIVAVVPAYNEQDSIVAVLQRMPALVADREVIVLVIDDGSSDSTAALAEANGATVVAHQRNLGLGAALRTGLTTAVEMGPACVVYLDADGEYPPEEMKNLVAVVLSGAADYVVGSRFAGQIERMLPHRRLGNQVLTRWVRFMTRRTDLTDGQSGYRAFSAAAAASAQIVHDYNYAQVLTLDLLGKGFRYAEVPISYRFRATGESFVKLGRYLRKVVPAVRRQLALSAVAQSTPLGGRRSEASSDRTTAG